MGDWYAPLKGTVSDSTVFILEGEKPGGTVLFLGGSHPCEIAGVMAAIVIVENAVVDEGKVIVIPHANRSGSDRISARWRMGVVLSLPGPGRKHEKVPYGRP